MICSVNYGYVGDSLWFIVKCALKFTELDRRVIRLNICLIYPKFESWLFIIDCSKKHASLTNSEVGGASHKSCAASACKTTLKILRCMCDVLKSIIRIDSLLKLC